MGRSQKNALPTITSAVSQSARRKIFATDPASILHLLQVDLLGDPQERLHPRRGSQHHEEDHQVRRRPRLFVEPRTEEVPERNGDAELEAHRAIARGQAPHLLLVAVHARGPRVRSPFKKSSASYHAQPRGVNGLRRLLTRCVARYVSVRKAS